MQKNNCAFRSELLVNGKKSLSYAFEKGAELSFTFYISRRLGLFNVKAEIFSDSDGTVSKHICEWCDIESGFDVYTLNTSIENVGLYFLKIKADSEKGEHLFEMQLTAYKKGYKTPDWIKGGIMYQIFCDRFARSEKYPLTVKEGAEYYADWENGIPQFPKKPGDPFKNNCFFGGSLYGIIEKLRSPSKVLPISIATIAGWVQLVFSFGLAFCCRSLIRSPKPLCSKTSAAYPSSMICLAKSRSPSATDFSSPS